MFSRFICINYMKIGKCTDTSCKLQHVKDIKILNNDEEEVKQEKPTIKPKKPSPAHTNRGQPTQNAALPLPSPAIKQRVAPCTSIDWC